MPLQTIIHSCQPFAAAGTLPSVTRKRSAANTTVPILVMIPETIVLFCRLKGSATTTKKKKKQKNNHNRRSSDRCLPPIS